MKNFGRRADSATESRVASLKQELVTNLELEMSSAQIFTGPGWRTFAGLCA